MEGPQYRGRSPSVGHPFNQRINHSPSPHQFDDQISPTDLTNAAYTSQSFEMSLSPAMVGSNIPFNPQTPYINGSIQPSQYQQPVLASNDYNSQDFGQSYHQDDVNSNLHHEPSRMNPQHQDQQYPSETLDSNTNFTEFAGKQSHFENPFLLDPLLQGNLQPQNQSINPADIMSNMSSPQHMAPSPPNLMPPEGPHNSRPTSPNMTHGQQWSPHHSRNVSVEQNRPRHGSLDPSTAYANGQHQEWGSMLSGSQFQTHRRAPSEHSDVSSSVAPSPFMAQQDTFDTFDQSSSPMLNPQQDQLYHDTGLGIETFTLSEQQHQRPSPRHSPFVSPCIPPQPGLGMAQDAQFMPLPEIQHNYKGGPESYTNQTEAFPSFPPEHRLPSNDMGQANQLAAPEINVEFAPNPRQESFEQPRYANDLDLDALSPPERGRQGRIRAKSDTFVSRPMTPSSNVSTLGSNDSSIDRRRSLSPYDVGFPTVVSRESSPAPRSPSRRSSTSSIPNRDYILELADPNRPSAPGTEKRIQKHPATFQCHLCPKKFTRAYNLRSHLRTHTDERPFICTVCTKAFARQHDRKRHEGLHSGEKKFVCKGELGTGSSWGCGRRFARADALGRHFRSEAGRVCIKPLLDEEAIERQRILDDQMMNHNMQIPGGIAPPAPMMGNKQGFALPAALLLQYPALQGLQWDQLGQSGPGDEELSGRNSFDAGSGGDFFDESEEGNGYMSGQETNGYVSDNPGPSFQTGVWNGGHEWRSDNERM